MSMDKLIVATLSNRARYKTHAKEVPLEDIGESTAWLLRQFGKFFVRNPEASNVDYDVLAMQAKVELEHQKNAPVLSLIEQARKVKVTKEQIQNTCITLSERGYSSRIASLTNRYQDGEELDLSHEIYKETINLRKQLGGGAASLFEEPDIHEILTEQATDDGLKFRQLCLQEHVKGLTPKKSVAVCAPVDAGKTSFLCDALTYIAPQVAKRHPGRPIIWFSNEGTVRDIWPRLYSAALGVNANELSRMPADKLYKAYADAVGGDCSIIKMKDAHGWTMAQVHAVIEELNPIIVVYDMLANFKVTGPALATHEKLEFLFQEVRELANEYNFISLSTMQLSAEGYDMLYPPGTALKGTKIGVQGALDLQIMIGRLNSQEYAAIRGFSLAKNKLKIVGKPQTFQAEVHFQPDISRFIDN